MEAGLISLSASHIPLRRQEQSTVRRQHSQDLREGAWQKQLRLLKTDKMLDQIKLIHGRIRADVQISLIPQNHNLFPNIFFPYRNVLPPLRITSHTTLAFSGYDVDCAI